jgi:hypothetical protein
LGVAAEFRNRPTFLIAMTRLSMTPPLREPRRFPLGQKGR